MRKEVIYNGHKIIIQVDLNQLSEVNPTTEKHTLNAYVVSQTTNRSSIISRDFKVSTDDLTIATKHVEDVAQLYIDEQNNPNGSRARQVLTKLGFGN